MGKLTLKVKLIIFLGKTGKYKGRNGSLLQLAKNQREDQEN